MKKIQYTLENSNLYYAAEIGDLEQVRHWLNQGGNPNYQEGQYTVLQKAVQNGHVAVVEYLLQHGADPNLKSSETGMTALMLANYGKMVHLLARYGANPAVCDRKRNNALVYYAVYNYVEAAEAWVGLKWPMNCKAKRLHRNLLTHSMFDMLSVLTGFVFTADNPVARIAEFMAGYDYAA